MDKLKVKIGQNFETGETHIVFMGAEGMIRSYFNFYTGESIIVKPGELIPTNMIFKVPDYLVTPLFQALAEALDEKNIKTPNHHTLEGEIKATQKHLQDLRQMLKLKS